MEKIKHIHYQFRRKDYSVRNDLCRSFYDFGEPYESIIDRMWKHIDESEPKLNIGEYFVVNCIQKMFIYRNENGIFRK